MVPEIGEFCLIVAFCLAVVQSTLPLAGLYRKKDHWIAMARPLALGQCFFITLSFVLLVICFLQNDFSVAYVARNSNSSLPIFYQVSAVWGGHEGSLLLWTLLFSGWVMMVTLCSRHLPMHFLARVLIILGWISCGFLLFLLATSSPFQRYLPDYPLDGRDLNPLLQDFGLIVHPPVLYMGYVGFAIPFAFALSVLWGNENDLPWAKWMRPWVLVAFGFLTVGIALGSWWAYYELGWGGWWFWDPVENASFMPWLVGIALIHSLMMSDKRQMFQGWSLLLAILTFALSLLGAFLVRSGILTSVHAFANDPTRGIFLLEFLGVVVGGSFGLYARRGKRFSMPLRLEWCSRETVILLSTVFLAVSTATVLLGTLFPLFYEVCTGQKLSVGFPYFNSVFIPLMLPVLLLIPIGPIITWGQNQGKELIQKVQWIGVLSVVLGAVIPWVFTRALSVSVALGVSLGIWIMLGTLKTAYQKSRQRGGVFKLSKGALGMIFAHLGMAVSIIGITIVSHYQIERDVVMKPGQSLEIAGEEIGFEKMQRTEGENYLGYQGHFGVSVAGKKIAELTPEKRVYVVQGQRLTETAIDPGFWRDIYISLGESLGEESWSVRLYYKPLVRWIWLGALMMAMGGLIAAWGRRTKGGN